MKRVRMAHLAAVAMLAATVWVLACSASNAFGAGARHRVVVSSDIGGSDPDDFQSMVHLLVYADVLEIEGLISSPFDKGRKQDILRVIDAYERDYENLRTYSDNYPTPSALRGLTKQGETEAAPYAGVRRATEGSEWIVKCARSDDPRPLHVLVWGGIEDLAQALHDAPDILPSLRVYYIGGPNKKWGPDAYHYIATNHRRLWMIEANSTYRGWFTGGNQEGEWDNEEFVTRHIRGHGTLGDFFVRQKKDLKMGDTPSVAWLLNGTPENPLQPGWGGQFVRAWERPFLRLERMPTREDRIEVFGIVELVLKLGAERPSQPQVRLLVENQSLPSHVGDDNTVHFRFSPKAPGTYTFTLRGNVASVEGLTGAITAVLPATNAARPSGNFPNWWTDDPSPGSAEGAHHGARTVSIWREEFLGDFASRMDRCRIRANEKGR